MSVGKTLLTRERFALTIERLCHQLLEDWGDFHNACIIGIQPRGTLVAQRIHARLTEDSVFLPTHAALDFTEAFKHTALWKFCQKK